VSKFWTNCANCVSRTLFHGASLILSVHLHLDLPSDTRVVNESFNPCNFHAIQYAIWPAHTIVIHLVTAVIMKDEILMCDLLHPFTFSPKRPDRIIAPPSPPQHQPKKILHWVPRAHFLREYSGWGVKLTAHCTCCRC